MDLDATIAQLRSGDRRALAKAITLVESARPEHAVEAAALIDALLPHTGQAIRVGLSGAPGVGKSTLIEALGCWLADAGHQVAVLAVDPSSRRSGGSIMGDKTRMERLARHPRAFIRPSPTGGNLGGVTRRSREALLLCEAAGFDVVLVETVGVGQSETAVADMVDFFALLILPGAGDELQGLKRGVVEMADAIVVTKTDAAPEAAGRAARDYASALHVLAAAPSGWIPRVLSTSALRGEGIEVLWQTVLDQRQQLGDLGLAQHRQEQAVRWLRNLVEDGLWQQLLGRPGVPERLAELEAKVRAGEIRPGRAAAELLGDKVDAC